MHKTTCTLVVGLFAILLAGSAAFAAEWGSLKGRFVVDGTPAKPAPLVVNKDAFCVQKMPANEVVVVGNNNSLVNALVFLRTTLGQKVEIHPDFEAELKKPVVLDNDGCTFKPHIVSVRVGQELDVKNSDPVSHNTNLTLLAFNPILPAKETNKVVVSKDAAYPTPVQCNIHPWMKGYMVSLSHPYAAVSGKDGTFEIKNIPAGAHEFRFWHEAPGNLKTVKFNGGATDVKGVAKLTIAAGKTLDLGDIKIPARVLVAQ